MTSEETRLLRTLTEAQVRATLIGEAPGFVNAVRSLPAIARSPMSVLISGETGTGKELVARALHYSSARADFPFVAVNCAALSETLLEDELFGHERGAFTDARAARRGLIAAADGGTLLLDEVDSLPLRAQGSLLRVLQDGTFRALGSAREQRANVRFLSATNARLEGAVARGAFRADLFYRLSVFTVELPPLRERVDDIALLARHFLEKHAPERTPRLAESALAALLAYDWPGNVRELENAMIRGVGLGADGEVHAEHLGLPGAVPSTLGTTGSPPSFSVLKQRAIAAFERGYLAQLMHAHGGNVSRAARAAGKERRDLGRLLRKHGLVAEPRKA